MPSHSEPSLDAHAGHDAEHDPGASGQREILRADPEERRRALRIVLFGVIVGVLAIGVVLPWATESAEEAVRGGMPKSYVCKAVLIGLMLFALPVAAFGKYTFGLGRRIAREECFPPAGQKVVRDTIVLRGRAARLLGRGQAFIGGALVVLSAALFALCSYGFAQLL